MIRTTSIKLDGEVPAKRNSRINTKEGRSFPSKGNAHCLITICYFSEEGEK